MPVSITIASGKGGVGKTSIAVNLALMLRKLGRRTTLMDVDFGLANTHILMGMKAQHSLADVVRRNLPITEAIETAPGDIKVLAGGSGTLEMLHASQSDRLQLIRNADALADETDILVVDAPAGADDNTLDFLAASDHAVIVIVAEPTSFMDAYALIKAANLERGLKRFSVIMNMGGTTSEAKKHFEKIQAIAMRFMDVELTYLGNIPYSRAMRRAVVDRKPVLSSPESSQTSEFLAFKMIAQRLLQAQPNESSGIKFFQGLDKSAYAEG